MGSTGPEKPKADVEQVIAEFERREPTLAAFCARTRSLVEACLDDAGIRYQSVQSRVKRKKKLREKYLDREKDYRELDDITDLAGLRVITYYDDEVDRVAEVIEKEFKIDTKESVDKRDTEPDRFGYRAINFVCKHSDKRTADVEYKKFADIICEIQVTSILGHAWSEIEHEWYDLRDAYPDEIKRRFSMIAALFELAGREFVDIRKSRGRYERAIALQVEAKVPDVPVDAVSLRSFIEQEPLVGAADRAIAEAIGMNLVDTIDDSILDFRLRAVRSAGFLKLQDIRGALARFAKALPEYAYRCKTELWPTHQSSGAANPGLSLYHLTSLLLAGQGESSIWRLYTAAGVKMTWSAAGQVGIAREILDKFSLR